METYPSGASDGHSDGVSPHSPRHPTTASIASQNGVVRSLSNSSVGHQTSLARKSSAGSTASRQRSPTQVTGSPRVSMSPPSTSKTHIGGVQPAAGFFRPQRPPVPPIRPPGPDRNPGELLELSPLGGRRSHESSDSFAISNENSANGLTSNSASNDASMLKHTQSTGRSLLAPLLPIGGRSRKSTESRGFPSSPKFEVRTSLDKIFRRTSSDTKRPSPTVEKSSSFFGRRPPSPIDLEIGPVPISRPSIPTSPSSPTTPTGPNTRQTYHLPTTIPTKSFEPRSRPVSITFTDNTNLHMDHSHAFISHPILSDPNGLFPQTTIRLPKSSSIKRNHHDYPSRNLFLFDGKLITGGGDSPIPFIATTVLVLGLTGVWFGTTAIFWWHHSAGGIAITIIGAYLSLLTITNMFVTAFRDPGILPRDLDPNPPFPAWSRTSTTDIDPQPLPRDILVRQNVLRVKYCSTCRTYRPPRATHCRLCDNCVDGCDHHCQWLNTCVGRRNYTSFIAVLVFGSITLVYTIITSAIHISLIHMSFRENLRRSIGSAVVFVLGLILFVPVSALFIYHIRLLLNNMTTVERLRTKAQIKLIKEQHSQQSNTSLPRNPFQMRWFNNLGYLLCRPAGFDWIEAGEPRYLDGRLINPGVLCEYQRRIERERIWTAREEERVDPGHAREEVAGKDLGNNEDEHANELDELRDRIGAGGDSIHKEKCGAENEKVDIDEQ